MPKSRPRTASVAGLKGNIQQLFNAMPIGVLLVNADGIIELANNCALQLLGYASGELVGRSVDILVPEHVRDVHRHHRHAYGANPEQRPMGFGRDLLARRKDGTGFPVEIGLAPFEGDNGPTTLCTIVDITERKRQDLEKDRLVKSLAERNAEITALYRVSELTRAGNLDAEALSNIAESVCQGLSSRGVSITLDGAEFRDSRFADSEHSIVADIEVGGRIRGSLTAHFASLDDAGHDNRLLEAFASAIAEAMERTEALAKVIHASQLASVGELAAGIGHEVNNPINGIINCVDILLRNAKDGTKERQYLDLIRQESYRISSIVSRLLAFSRSGSSKSTPSRIDRIIDDVLALCRKRIEKSKIQLRVQTEPDLPVMDCQPEQMQQVLLNLVLNAVHALDQRFPDGDPRKVLSVSAAQRTVRSAPHIEITVEDHGAGIRPEHRDRIFDPFFSTKGQAGTGLGLSVSLNIVRSHGGWIYVESEPDEYTRFIVQCPVNPQEEQS